MLTEQRKITLLGQAVHYILKRSDRARHARLEIRPESGLTVVVPARYSGYRIQSFLIEKQRWIVDKIQRYQVVQTPPTAPLKAGDSLPYLGRNMKIETRENGREAGKVSLDRESLVVCLAPGDTGLHSCLEVWYREQAKNKIEPMVEDFSKRMSLRYRRITVKGQKTLWGSCSRKGNLNFNWRLMMTPEEVIRYVVVHELAHLKQMNHSRRFWDTVEKYCPSWREERRWLRDHSQELARLLPA